MAAVGSGGATDLLRSSRLTLRHLHPGDAQALHGVFSDPIAMQYFSDIHTDIAETTAWLRGTLGEPAKTAQEFAILRDSQVIGKAGIWSAPELGFFLHRGQWGQGLMHEALQSLLPHLFRTMSLPQITADVDPRNVACLQLLQQLGFAETGRAEKTINIAGTWCDSVYLSCSAPPV